MSSANLLHGRRASVARTSRKQDVGNDFLKVISVDLSPLELRFENIFSRLAAIEKHLSLKKHQDEGTSDALNQEKHDSTGNSARSQTPETPESTTIDGGVDHALTNTNNDNFTEAVDETAPKQKVYTDGVALAQEIESLRATQLRLKINQELAHSTLQLELAQLKSDLEQGMAADLQEFRDEVAAASNSTTKAFQNEYQRLAQTINVTLSERQVAENRWKATFEDTIAARIQDIWSGLHSTSRKLQERMQFLQTEMVTQEKSSREINAFVDSMKASSERFDQDSKKYAKMLAEQEKGMEDLHDMCSQTSERLDEQDGKLMSQVDMIRRQMEIAGSRVQQHIQAYDAFVTATGNTFTTIASDLTSCNDAITAHQASLFTLDDLVQHHSREFIRANELMEITEGKLGSIDGRVALTEKKLTTTMGIMEERYQERQQLIAAIQASINQATLERVAMKHAASDLGFSIQEVQHKLMEVGKLAKTTESALERTVAELPKIHALVSTNSSNIAKNRQNIRDVTTMIEDDRKVASKLRSEFNKEVADSVVRFTAAEERDAQAQDAIADAAEAAGNVKSDLEARIVKNGNLIHQLNTMVDSLAITETTEDMEDKMGLFAVACAQLGLKLEFFGRKATSVDGACAMKTDVKANLAIVLAKVIRFLGSGVSIDQNCYLLTAKRSQAVDPITGQVTLEIPPQHVLDGFRIAKATVFANKTRTAMDQLQPVARTNRTSIDFRDAFERKLRFVLEFGLANLFPNTGKPKNPTCRRGGEFGTCIACDRPIDSDDCQHEPDDSDIPLRHRAQHEYQVPTTTSQSANTAPEQHQRSTSPNSRPNSAATRNRIDMKTVVRGRSGTSNVRPKTSGDSVHNPPGTGEFVYRGGFRIPKQNPNAVTSASVNSLFNLSVASTPMISSDNSQATDGPLDVDTSSLEKVALLGKHQVVGTPPSNSISGANGTGAAAVRAARPHTAPLRMKSLPRLDMTSPTLVDTTAEQPLQQISS